MNAFVGPPFPIPYAADRAPECPIVVAYARSGPPKVIAVAAMFTIENRTETYSEFLGGFLMGEVTGPPANDLVCDLAAIEYGVGVSPQHVTPVIVSTAEKTILRLHKPERFQRGCHTCTIRKLLMRRGAKVSYIKPEEMFQHRRVGQIAAEALRAGMRTDPRKGIFWL